MIERILILVAVLALAWAAQAWWVRRIPTGRLDLPPGLSLVIGEGCRLCRPALTALRRAGPELEVRVIDARRARQVGLAVSSVPTAVVVDETGRVRERRSGTAVLREAPRVAAVARAALGRPSAETAPDATPHRTPTD